MGGRDPTRIRRIVLYAIVYIAAGALFIMPLTMPMLRSGSDFSVYNFGWKGCSQLARRLYDSGKEVYPLHTPFASVGNRPQDENTALMVIGPSKPFTASDVDYIARFAASGGTVFLANDFGEGNSLLDSLELGYRFSEHPLADMLYEKDPYVVSCSARGNSTITRDIGTFTLNCPAAITGRIPGDALVLARSSTMSWLDSSRDRIWQRSGETRSSFPVLLEQEYGEGEILVLSDPSVFINGMIDLHGNRELYDNIVDYMTRSEITRIYIDEEHHALVNPMEVFTVVLRRVPDYPRLLMVWVILTALILVVHPRLRQGSLGIVDRLISIVLWILTLGARPEEEKRIDPVEECMKKHPDWDRDLLRRIAGER
jgi:hypothetical protein